MGKSSATPSRSTRLARRPAPSSCAALAFSGTLAILAEEIAVYPAMPLPENAEDYALSFSMPMDIPGLRFLCRDSASSPGNAFDRPLSSRFDEQDSFVIFDDGGDSTQHGLSGWCAYMHGADGTSAVSEQRSSASHGTLSA